MKKLPLFLTALLITATACDKIDTSNEIFEIISPVEITPWDSEFAETVIQKIYIEEFTGHACTYCPDGARILKKLMDEDSTVIATAIHCTNLANPGKFPFDKNFKTPMGDEICAKFKISGLPKAMINRKENGSNGWGFDRNKWRSEVAKIDRSNVRAGIELQCTINEIKQEIEAKASVTAIKEMKNPVQLCIVLQQDSIISGQIDNGKEILDYVHNHVLRAGFNRHYGIKLTQNGMVEAEKKYTIAFKLFYGNIFSNSSVPVVIKNCSVVAYLLDMKTQEMIQVETWHATSH